MIAFIRPVFQYAHVHIMISATFTIEYKIGQLKNMYYKITKKATTDTAQKNEINRKTRHRLGILYIIHIALVSNECY